MRSKVSHVEISFVVPIRNEEHTIKSLFDGIRNSIKKNKIESFEVIFIDDGSTDASWKNITELYDQSPEIIRAIKFRKNFGKSQALTSGFECSKGSLVFTIDGDLQDDPKEISNYLNKLDEGYDLVSGWKQNRQDPWSKTIPSKLFNWVTSRVSGIKLHDFNCGFKLYKKEVVENIHIYGELHRYIPVLAHDLGFKIGEVAVNHNERKFGSSKYGMERMLRGFLDLLTVLVTTRYLQRPNHLFGGIGIFFGLFGFGSLGYLTVLWFIGLGPIGTRPLLAFGILSVMVSIQMLSLGLISELINKSTRSIRSNEQIVEKNLN